MRIVVTPDYESLSEEAAEVVAKAVLAKPTLSLGLPTGSTPLGMYQALIRKHRSGGLDFSSAKTFNLDEYAGISPAHPQSFHTYMRARFFDYVNLAAKNTHIPDGSPDTNPTVEANRYESSIYQSGGIDLLIVGVGMNGHIAFNEPGSPFDSRTRVVTLAPETLKKVSQEFGTSKGIPQIAITVGIGNVLEARRILMLASGAAKAEIVRRALRGPVSEAVPASALQLHPDVITILDEEASGTLQ